ncbi:MAG TPA: serine hydrolase domain-containing protein [bacterium]|jgi:CubicO group peptidase (beta-lactamase class C family)
MTTAAAALRPGTPDAARLDPSSLADAGRLIDAAIADGVFPGAVALIARGGIIGWRHAAGHAQILPAVRAMQTDTVFDLASLTKVLGTLPVAMRLWADGMVDLDAPVATCLREFSGAGREAVTLRHLLAHTSGLPAWVMLYLRARSRADMLAEICRTPLAHGVGERVDYSDLGILLLGFALERVTGRRIDALVAGHVTDVLGIADLCYAPPPPMRARCAATEQGNAYEREKAAEAGDGFPWRTEVLVGEVHDGNAHYGMEGIAPHAGVFGTADAVATVAFQWLRPGAYLGTTVVAEATHDQRAGARDYPRGLGWVLHHRGVFFEALGPRAFGHTGFTGTSVAVDPDRDLVVVLLTNRVHPRADDLRIQDFRIAFHHAVMEAMR